MVYWRLSISIVNQQALLLLTSLFVVFVSDFKVHTVSFCLGVLMSINGQKIKHIKYINKHYKMKETIERMKPMMDHFVDPELANQWQQDETVQTNQHMVCCNAIEDLTVVEVKAKCSFKRGLGGGGGETRRGFNKSYCERLSMQVREAWSIIIVLCNKNGSPRIIGIQRPGAIRAFTVFEVQTASRETSKSLM